MPHRDLLAKFGAGAGSSHRAASGAAHRLWTMLRTGVAAAATMSTRAVKDDDGGGEEVVDPEDIEADEEDVDFDGPPPFVTCPFCSRRSCVRCAVPAHALVTRRAAWE